MSSALDFVPMRPRPQLLDAAPRAPHGEHRLDLDGAQVGVALAELGAALKELAAARFSRLEDLSCVVSVDVRRGVCSLHFRASG